MPASELPMTSIRNLTPAAKLVAQGRQKFARDFAGQDQQFNDAVWEISFLLQRPQGQQIRRLYFHYHQATDRPLPSPYADVIKSWLLLTYTGRSVSGLLDNLNVARIFWKIIQTRHGATEIFEWKNINEEDLNQAELFLRNLFAPATVYKRMRILVSMLEFLSQRAICRPLYYTIQTPSPRDYRKILMTQQETRMSRLPSDKALHGLARIYNQLAQSPPDRLLSAAVAILIVTGFRMGELIALPLDCEIEEEHNGRLTYGLRYFKEKSKDNRKQLSVRWLTPLQAELARQAIATIRDITASARERAKELERQPDRVSLPDCLGDDILRPDELTFIMGVQNRDSLYRMRCLPRRRDEAGYYYIAAEVEQALMARRAKRLWSIKTGPATYQMLSETLLIAYKNFFHSQKATLPLFVEMIRPRQINEFLSSARSTKSAFERYDIREDDGSFCAMTSHQFRHWLNTLADKGGLPIDLLTRWMGREYPRDTEAYRHLTMDERLQWVKAGIRHQEMGGVMTDVYFELPVDERDSFLEAQIQAVHFTPMGLCVHDFALEPCPYHLNCVRGCADYLRVKGNERERACLLQLKTNTEQALAQAREFADKHDNEIAQAWVNHHKETLQGIAAALKKDGV